MSVPLPSSLPSGCTTGCAATLHVYPASYPSKEVRVPVHFFNYRRPALKSVFPLEGSEQGGSLVSLTLEDYQVLIPLCVVLAVYVYVGTPRPPWAVRVGGGCYLETATWNRECKLPWREAGLLNHLDDYVDSDQYVVNSTLSVWGAAGW
jgi:hypothetical protein